MVLVWIKTNSWRRLEYIRCIPMLCDAFCCFHMGNQGSTKNHNGVAYLAQQFNGKEKALEEFGGI